MLNAYGGGYAPPMLQFGAPPSNAAPRGASPNLALDFRGGILAAHGHEQAEETMREPSADGWLEHEGCLGLNPETNRSSDRFLAVQHVRCLRDLRFGFVGGGAGDR